MSIEFEKSYSTPNFSFRLPAVRKLPILWRLPPVLFCCVVFAALMWRMCEISNFQNSIFNSISVVRMERPAYNHYRLITNRGDVLNYDHKPEDFVMICNQGFPVKVLGNGQACTEYMSEYRSFFMGLGIVLTLITYSTIWLVWKHRTWTGDRRRLTFTESDDIKANSLRKGICIQLLQLFIGNILSILLIGWSPWLLLGLISIVIHIAMAYHLERLQWGVVCLAIVGFVFYYLIVNLTGNQNTACVAKDIYATPIFVHQYKGNDEFVTHVGRGKKHSYVYTPIIYYSLLNYSWKDKTRYLYIELETDSNIKNRKGIVPEEFLKNEKYVELLKTGRIPICIENNNGLLNATLQEPNKR